MGKILDSIKEQHELEIPLTENEIDWLIEEAEKLNDIKKAMGLSHADSFNIGEAINDIRNILEFN